LAFEIENRIRAELGVVAQAGSALNASTSAAVATAQDN
jgi:hypothetical protein